MFIIITDYMLLLYYLLDISLAVGGIFNLKYFFVWKVQTTNYHLCNN